METEIKINIEETNYIYIYLDDELKAEIGNDTYKNIKIKYFIDYLQYFRKTAIIINSIPFFSHIKIAKFLDNLPGISIKEFFSYLDDPIIKFNTRSRITPSHHNYDADTDSDYDLDSNPNPNRVPNSDPESDTDSSPNSDPESDTDSSPNPDPSKVPTRNRNLTSRKRKPFLYKNPTSNLKGGVNEDTLSKNQNPSQPTNVSTDETFSDRHFYYINENFKLRNISMGSIDWADSDQVNMIILDDLYGLKIKVKHATENLSDILVILKYFNDSDINISLRCIEKLFPTKKYILSINSVNETNFIREYLGRTVDKSPPISIRYMEEFYKELFFYISQNDKIDIEFFYLSIDFCIIEVNLKNAIIIS